ncbi:MAG: diguanylate cyclase [Ignavibacteria bacterium]|nr:diguanylate cyclase [Ignavibacteria bacterium]
MEFSDKHKKRILIFLLIPILIAVPFFTEDLYMKLIAGIILLVYIGFIIFLRDLPKQESSQMTNGFDDIEIDDEEKLINGNYKPDHGEDFKIVSSTKNLEFITSESLNRSFGNGKKEFFKPQDFKENFEKIVHEELPRDVSHDEQFGFVLEKILHVVKDSFMAHTAAFFWFNKNKKRLTLERYVSSSSKIAKQKFDLVDDILGKIIQKEEPEVFDVSSTAEQDVIRYYTSPQGIKSFLGVPLFYGKSLTGIFVLDSKVTDAFGIEHIYALGRIVRVISVIITLFEEKYSDSQSERRLNALLGVINFDKKFESETDLYNAIENAIHGLLEWDAFTFVSYLPLEHKFKTARIINKTSLKYIGQNLEIDLTGTLVGKSILSSSPVKIDDTTETELPRFSKNEDVSFDGSFLAIPLLYDEQNYGVLCFESLKKNVYSNSEVNFIKNSTKIFAFILHSHSTISILKNLLSVDIETRTLNYDSFRERLAIELVKGKELNVQSAISLIRVDDFLAQESLFEHDPFPKVLRAVSQMIREEMTPFNILGRISEKIFAVYFFNLSSKEVFLWSEKLRIKIARKPIAVVSKQTTFTVSIGVASTTGKTDIQEVLHDAELALKKALEKGGNSVKSTS